MGDYNARKSNRPAVLAGVGGRLISECVPLPAGLDQRPAKRTSLKSHQPSEPRLSLAHLGLAFPAWGGCGSGAGWTLCPCELMSKPTPQIAVKALDGDGRM